MLENVDFADNDTMREIGFHKNLLLTFCKCYYWNHSLFLSESLCIVVDKGCGAQLDGTHSCNTRQDPS